MSYLFCLSWLSLGIWGLTGLFRYLRIYFNDEDDVSDILAIVSAMILTPVFASVILWLIMVIFPGVFSLKTLGAAVMTCYTLLAVCFSKHALKVIKNIWLRYTAFWHHEKFTYGIPLCLVAIIILLIFSGVLARFVSIKNFDIIEYVMGGDYFARTRSIVYNGYFIDTTNGFIYFTYHSFLMLFFGTLGVFFHETINLPQDWYIKFLNGYYWVSLNIVSAVFLCRRKKDNNWQLLVCALLLLNVTPVIGDRLISYGIDFFRLACFTVGIGAMWELTKSPSIYKAILTVLLCSAAAASHLTQACMIPFFCLLPLFMKKDWHSRLYYTVAIGCGILLLGYSHYFLQLFAGDKWLWAVPAELTSTNYPHHLQKSFILRLLEGHLGIFFNFEIYSLACLTAALLFFTVSGKKEARHLFLLGVTILCILLIAMRAYANYRYSFSLYYLMLLAVFAVLLNQKMQRNVHLLTLCATSLTILYSFFIFWRHLTDIKFYITPSKFSQTEKSKICTAGELFSILKNDGPTKIALWAKNKLLQRNAALPLCYISPDKIINWLYYRNDVLPEIYTEDSFCKTLSRNFSHVILDKKAAIDAKTQQAVLKDSILLCETDHYSVYRLKPLQKNSLEADL